MYSGLYPHQDKLESLKSDPVILNLFYPLFPIPCPLFPVPCSLLYCHNLQMNEIWLPSPGVVTDGHPLLCLSYAGI
jgi:hypothetical protein